MIAVGLGLVLGGGLALVAAPWLWPTGVDTERVPRRDGLGARLAELLVQAGFARLRPVLFLVLTVMLAVAAGGLALGLFAVPGLAAVAAVTAVLLPFVLLSGRARRRRRAARAAWPDLIDHLVAGLRAGFAPGEAVASLTQPAPAALSPGFEAFERRWRGYSSFDSALDELKEALADPVADRVVETLRVAREVGGTELPGVLRGLSSALRQEAATRAEAEARQSWVIAAARLGVVAPWIVILVLATRPEAAGVYASPGGTLLVVTGFVVTVVAYRIMLAVGRLPEDRRWFA